MGGTLGSFLFGFVPTCAHEGVSSCLELDPQEFPRRPQVSVVRVITAFCPQLSPSAV